MYTVISRPNCSWCDKAEDLLKFRNIDYQKVDIYEEVWVKTLMLQTELTTVPQVFDTNGFLIGGYEELEMHINNLDLYQ